jgi:hypothetical protein
LLKNCGYSMTALSGALEAQTASTALGYFCLNKSIKRISNSFAISFLNCH